MTAVTPRVLIIGAGPAGLTAAAELAPTVRGEILVLDREDAAGGIPRHSDHTGYGLRDLKRVMTGPTYARSLAERAERAGATIRTRAMVTGWADDGAAEVTTPQGLLRVHADAVILATGARERPRSARLIPGDRPHGVYTTGQLQNLVHLHHGNPGSRAVVVGAELVSWSAVLTLREAGCATVLMTTEHPRAESYALVNLAGRYALRTPLATRSRVVRVIGRGRVSGVEIEHIDSGARETVACDTVVFTGDWIPDHELARIAGLAMDPATRGPVVDTALRTSQGGTFAAGNLIHPVDTADIAALDGRHAASQVRAYLYGRRPSDAAADIVTEAPFTWITPQLLRAGDPAPVRNRLLLWTSEHVSAPHISVRQRGREVAHRRVPWPASPGRAFRVPAALLKHVDPSGGPVTVSLRTR
jgi:thioredoxin reductase